jgi:hypothetical protein
LPYFLSISGVQIEQTVGSGFSWFVDRALFSHLVWKLTGLRCAMEAQVVSSRFDLKLRSESADFFITPRQPEDGERHLNAGTNTARKSSHGNSQPESQDLGVSDLSAE